MALLQSAMIPLGTPAPPFALPDAVSGRIVRREDFGTAPGLLVAFLCNHCPYVKHMLDGFITFARECGARDLGVVAICSNDAVAYPADAPPEMAKLARARGFSFPYLVDESQAVARAYSAVCTPDLFLFGRDGRLAYRGQFDGSRPGSRVPVTGADLRAAADAVLSGQPAPAQQVPSMGCSIKWKKAL
jgi:peroxiredoxin